MELEVLCDEITQEFCDLDHLTQTEDNAHRTTADIVVWLGPRGRENDIQIPPFAYTGWEKALKIPSHQRKLFSAVSVRVCKRPLLTEETPYTIPPSVYDRMNSEDAMFLSAPVLFQQGSAFVGLG